MKKRTALVFIVTAGRLTGCHGIWPSSPELPTPGNLYLDEYESNDPQIPLADHREELVPYMKYVEG